MKNLILSAITMTFAFTACESNTTKKVETHTANVETTAAADTMLNAAEEQLFSCSMHPEVIGKKDEKCSKCGMKLNVAVKK